MNKRIAVPANEQGVLDAHFGHCKLFAIFEVKDGKIDGQSNEVPPPHEPGLLPKWLAEKKVTDIIAGGMGQRAIDLFLQNGINTYVGAPQINASELIQKHLNGDLVCRANYCDH